ncbi:nucleotidyltransferase [Jeotgalibacillus haloalkalitolerans]|uniref:tRNA(Met) cytidine acetate ligase n=1 Tax=Jeotgalibacillus haloalkalitolerans TaxID=3104292 RepID=A0ABU5KJV5_9BACL|nr:nucleotidyltransferase [Jeotgalibacillus sp. HH7-29]MDZ5711549.1 nucleotidyltransferase [Jeotgalibacillus sp. HH7-29]
MRACGLVVEYNPFHNGHELHATQSRAVTDCDVVIAVMSGNFLQRGEPALCPKHERAEMALRSGVDIVFELPYHFAVQHATIFAEGAVKLLNAAGCDSFCFGSENGQIEPFLNQLELEKAHHDKLQQTIREQMKLGKSYPAAAAEGYRLLFNQGSGLDLSKPNNMLGYQYITAADKFTNMKPFTIRRTSSDYHDEALHQSYISSATSIRKKIFEEGMHGVLQHVPESSYQIMEKYTQNHGQLMNWNHFWPFLQHMLITSSPSAIKTYYEVEEGIEYRLIDAAMTSTSYEAFMQQVKTKRYTWTRIQRMLTHLITKTQKEEIQQNTSPAYLRMLGMTAKGREYMNTYKKDSTLPVISNLNQQHHELCAIDIRASKAYAMGFSNPVKRKEMLSRDFTAPPVMIK